MLFLLKNTVFTVLSGKIQNPVVLVLYYHMPFFSNVDTQVTTNGAQMTSTQSPTGLIQNYTGFALKYLCKDHIDSVLADG